MNQKESTAMAEHKRHQGHRQRMRERVQNYGLDSLAEHEALEYVLYLTNAQKDTNGIAHDLIDRFGDFAAVLEASEEELCTVEGVGPATARMLHLLPEISRYYGRSRTSTTRCPDLALPVETFTPPYKAHLAVCRKL
jgi:DNA repair protein RadC